MTSTKSAQKAETRRNILQAAGKLFRKNGFSATGVDAVMTEAGLTAGGFYAHFDSKQKLLEECLLAASERIMTYYRENVPAGELNKILSIYLSPQHRDHPETGCMISTLGAEITREGVRSQRAVDVHLQKMCALLKTSSQVKNEEELLFLMASALGVLQISRVIQNRQKSDRFLLFAKTKLCQLFSR